MDEINSICDALSLTLQREKYRSIHKFYKYRVT